MRRRASYFNLSHATGGRDSMGREPIIRETSKSHKTGLCTKAGSFSQWTGKVKQLASQAVWNSNSNNTLKVLQTSAKILVSVMCALCTPGPFARLLFATGAISYNGILLSCGFPTHLLAQPWQLHWFHLCVHMPRTSRMSLLSDK